MTRGEQVLSRRPRGRGGREKNRSSDCKFTAVGIQKEKLQGSTFRERDRINCMTKGMDVNKSILRDAAGVATNARALRGVAWARKCRGWRKCYAMHFLRKVGGGNCFIWQFVLLSRKRPNLQNFFHFLFAFFFFFNSSFWIFALRFGTRFFLSQMCESDKVENTFVKFRFKRRKIHFDSQHMYLFCQPDQKDK